MSRKCFLTCVRNSHPPISLSDKVEVQIGRSQIMKIKDQSCSRHQLRLKPNFADYTVEVTQIGINPSGLDGFAMSKDAVYKVSHASRIEVLLNNYIHTIDFDPPPEGYEQKANVKRKLDDPDPESNKRKSIQLEQIAMESPQDIWEEVDHGELYIYTAKGVKSSDKIAAFDMDGTLIKPKSGKVHPVDINDWQILFPVVPDKLKETLSNGFKIIILSNQAGIGNGKMKIKDFKVKIENVVKKLAVPIQVYISTGKGFYRKPATGMWKYLTEQKNDNIEIDMQRSFYCGDAAGRLANWAPGKKKDHSMADKLMAENLGLQFYTPEQFFLGHSIKTVPFAKPEFHPGELDPSPFNHKLISDEKEILVLVGFPGSGKSFLAKQIEKNSNHRYVTVCRDVLGSWQRCAAEATKALERGKSVIVDSTNPDVESRARWTSLSRERGVRARCGHVVTSLAHARHNNKYRELRGESHLPVNDIVFHSYKNKFAKPTTDEGFKEVIDVKFSATFDNDDAEKMYRMHLLEK